MPRSRGWPCRREPSQASRGADCSPLPRRNQIVLPLRPLFWYYQLMAKSSQKKASRKKGGRPATGRDPVFTIRLSSDLRQRIGAWAKKQRTAPSRSEAIRSLIEAGLAASLPVRKTSARGALKAREL